MPDRSKDLYTNYFPMFHATGTAADNVLVEATHDTGLSVRGAMIWLIHAIKVMCRVTLGHNIAAADVPPVVGRIAISTKKGLTGTACPYLVDSGCVFAQELQYQGEWITAAGFETHLAAYSWREPHLPPIPLASQNLSLYLISADVSELQIGYTECIVEYTTLPLTQALYTEIAEVWQW